MKKVLLVDALEASLARHRALLRRGDVSVLTATSGDAALAVHREERADVMVVDLGLPRGGGEALCAAVREDPELKQVSVIVICKKGDDALARAARCRANACLTRPVAPAQLRAAVDRLLSVPARRSYRVLVRVEANGAAAFFCNSGNLSAAGMLIEADAALAKGDRVTCSFFLPERERIVASAEVVRAAGAAGARQYGLRFLDLDAQKRAAIDAFVDGKPARG